MSAVAALGHGCLPATVKASHNHFQSQKLKPHGPKTIYLSNYPNPNPNPIPISTNNSLSNLFSLKPPLFSAYSALESDSLSSPSDSKSKKYHFVVANAKFMLDEEEHFKELMFERLRLFGERNMEQDFWLVIEPKFLDKFPAVTKRLSRPAVALVSTNSTWITFMKLRLDRVLAESFEAESVEEALASNPTDIKFEKPDKWVAPYAKYEPGWWEAFLPPASKAEAKV